MIFQTPIKRITQPNYAEGSALRSVRDADNTSKQWLRNKVVKSQGLSDNIAMAQLIQRLNKLQRRQIGYQSQQPAFFPFKIYNIGNVSATDAQKVLFAGLDINRFTFQIRSGIAGLRSKFSYGPSLDGSRFGEYETETFCECTDDTMEFDSPPTANAARSVQLLNNVDVLLFDPVATIPFTTPCQILLDPTADSLGFIQAAFWLKILDTDPNISLGLRTQLWGRMFTGDPADPTSRPTNCLPSFTDQSIIPLAKITINNSPPSTSLDQYQWGNLVNRYASIGPVDSTLGPVNIQRGYWTADSLVGQVFYKGDVLVDDSASLFNGEMVSPPFGYFYGVYTFVGDISIGGSVASVTSPPSADATPWRMTGTIYSATEL